MRLVLFDCDGTLADSFGIICEAMRVTFETAGLPAPEEAATRVVIGLSLDRAIARLTPTSDEAHVAELVELYRQSFHRLRTTEAERELLFPGNEGLLRRLAMRDELFLGMVTGKSRRGVTSIIEARSLQGIFTTIRTADDCPSKPHPAMVLESCAEVDVEPADTLVIGDAIFDMAMAAAAGAGGLGVSWGAGTPEALIEAGASAVVGDVEALEAAIESWLARPGLSAEAAEPVAHA